MTTTSQSPKTLPRWLPLVILAITIGLLFHRLLSGEVLFWGLPSLQFYPWRTLTLSELAAGRLPLWNPYNGAGAPLLANFQSAVLYPPNLLTDWITGPQVMGWLGMLHLLWAGVGMWLFLETLEISDLGRGVGAISFALNTAVVARFGTLPMVDTAAWLPWLMFAVQRIGMRRSPLNLALLALVTALMLLAGHAQWSFYSFILAGCYALYQGMRAGWKTFVMTGFAVVLGIALTAIQLAPTAELQRQSQRAGGVDETFALNFSNEVPLLVTLLNPNFYGNPGDGSYQINGAAFETAAYSGILPIVVAVGTTIYVLWTRRRRTRVTAAGLVPFFAAVALVALWFSLGKNSLVYVLLFRYVPTFNLFQAPARWLLLTVFSVSVLAGIGLTLWKPDRFMKMRSRLLLAGAGGVTVLGLVLRAATGVELLNGVIGLGLLLFITAALFVAMPNPTHPRWRMWSLMVLILVSADLLWANRLSNPSVPASFYASQTTASPNRTFRTEKELDAIQFDQFLLFKDYRVAVQKQDAYREADLPNMNMLEQRYSLNTFEPLRPGGIDHFLKLLNEHPVPNLLTAAGVSTLSQVGQRAWLVTNAAISRDPFEAMMNPAWDPTSEVFLEGDTPTLKGTTKGTATLTETNAQQLQVEVNAPVQSILVVADTWYPGWTARVDETPAVIYRANGAFRGVLIPEGRHTVRMVYDPPALKIGAVISAAALILWGVIVIYGYADWRRRQQQQQPQP